jgi:hypothetical protein
MDISQLLDLGFAFKQKLDQTKAGLAPAFDWYPYDSLSNLVHLDHLLSGDRRRLLDLIAARFIRRVGNPMAIGREVSPALIEPSLKEGHRSVVPLHQKQPQVPAFGRGAGERLRRTAAAGARPRFGRRSSSSRAIAITGR